MMTDGSQRKEGAVLSYISIIVSTLVQLLYTPFLVRMLGQSEYGLYSLISSIIGYLTVLDLGFGNAIIVFTSKYRAQGKIDEEKKLHGMFFVVFIIIGVIAGLLGIMLYFLTPYIFSSTLTTTELSKTKIMMIILAINLVITFSFSIYSSIITAYEKFTFQKIVSILNTICKPLLMIPLLFLGYKSIALTIVITVVNIFVCLSNYLYCKRKLKINIKFSGFNKVLFKTILGYSIWIFMGTIVDKVNWSVDHFVLGAVSGTIAVSVYAIASQLNTLFINLSTAVSSVMLPKMSKMVANNASNDELTDELIKVGRIQYYIIFLMASGLVIFGKQFIIWWAGIDYSEAYYVALILILPLCFPLIQNLGLSIMQAKNKYKFKSITTAIMAIFNIIISVILAKKYGPIGSAVGTAMALIICNIIIINIYYEKNLGLNIKKFWFNIFKMTFNFIIPIALILFIKNILIIKGIMGLFIYIIIYSIIYAIVSYLLVMNNYEKQLVNKVLMKLHLVKRG